MNNNNNEAIKRVCETANALFPGLNVSLNELSQPTESFLTRILVHYLRAYGFRVEPPYNIEGEGNDVSKEKRQFLSKLCRQVERILQISFPGRTYTYIDIIQPTAKKTFNTLDVLSNYYCFCKMHKKEVMAPINERHKERQSRAATIAAKERQLEEHKDKAAQIRIDLANCEANIKSLRDELPKVQGELENRSKIFRHKQAELASQEELLTEITNQVSNLKQQVIKEGELEAVKTEKEHIVSKIDSYKLEMAKLEQIFKERRIEMEEITRLNDEIEQLMKILPPELINDFKENLKQTERMEKKHSLLESKHQNLLATKDKNKQLLDKCEEEFKVLKLQYDQDGQIQQQKILDQQSVIDQLTVAVEEATNRKRSLQLDIAEEQQAGEQLRTFVNKLLIKHDS